MIILEKHEHTGCPTGTCYKQPNGGNYPMLYRTNDAWVYQTDVLSFELSGKTRDRCCPKDNYGSFLTTDSYEIDCFGILAKNSTPTFDGSEVEGAMEFSYY